MRGTEWLDHTPVITRTLATRQKTPFSSFPVQEQRFIKEDYALSSTPSCSICKDVCVCRSVGSCLVEGAVRRNCVPSTIAVAHQQPPVSWSKDSVLAPVTAHR